MALDKALVLTQKTKQKAPNNPVVARRNRLITRIKNQLVYLVKRSLVRLGRSVVAERCPSERHLISAKYVQNPIADELD